MALMQLAEANKRSKARPAPAAAAKQPGASGWRVRIFWSCFGVCNTCFHVSSNKHCWEPMLLSCMHSR